MPVTRRSDGKRDERESGHSIEQMVALADWLDEQGRFEEADVVTAKAVETMQRTAQLGLLGGVGAGLAARPVADWFGDTYRNVADTLTGRWEGGLRGVYQNKVATIDQQILHLRKQLNALQTEKQRLMLEAQSAGEQRGWGQIKGQPDVSTYEPTSIDATQLAAEQSAQRAGRSLV